MKSIFFTIVFILNFSIIASSQIDVPTKVNEVGDTTDGNIKKIVQDIRDVELQSKAIGKLFIVNYGSKVSIRTRLLQLEKAFIFLGMDRKVIEIATDVKNPFLITEFWIVPEKAENPKPTKYAEKVGEIGVATDSRIRSEIQKFHELMEKTPNSIAYFVNYGTKKQKAIRIKQINKSINFLKYDRFRLMVFDGGYMNSVKTEFWISEPKEKNN